MSNPYGSPDNPFDDDNGTGSGTGSTGDGTDRTGGSSLPSYGDYASGTGDHGAVGDGNPYGAPAGGYNAAPGGGVPYGDADQSLFPTGSAYPGAGRRFGAFLIDTIIVGIVSFIIGMLFGQSTTELTVGTQLLLSLISIVLWFAYRVGMETSRGATLGKMALGMKVVDTDGRNLTAQNSFMRNVWYLVSSVVSIVPFIGWLFSLAVYIAVGVTISRDPYKQSYADKWGHAYVVNAR